MAKVSAALLLWALETALTLGQSPAPANQQRFYGKWTLDEARSKVVHPSDLISNRWRSYEPDGDRVKVSWANSTGKVSSYSARCDRTAETGSGGQIRCWQVDPNTMEGEQLDPSDAQHKYYRRAVSADGKALTITWYADSKRVKASERFVYTKQ